MPIEHIGNPKTTCAFKNLVLTPSSIGDTAAAAAAAGPTVQITQALLASCRGSGGQSPTCHREGPGSIPGHSM